MPVVLTYVVPGSDAEAHATGRLSNKSIGKISNGLRPTSVKGFFQALPLIFQRGRSEGLNAVYHFTFTGEEHIKGTVVIKNKTISVKEENVGQADVHITADSQTWVLFLGKEKSIVWALLTRKIKIKGSLKLLPAFGKCFPS